MQVKKKKGRILKVLGKSLTGLLVFWLGFVLLLHIPFVQSCLSKQIPVYLSKRIGAKVELHELSFSVLGCARVQGLRVWNPDDQMILSLDTLEVKANYLDLLSGNVFLKQVKVNGFYGKLVQEEDKTLNIQYILNAFSGGNKNEKSSVAFDIQCKNLQLENIDFSFLSHQSQVEVHTLFKSLYGAAVSFQSTPTLLHFDSLAIAEHQLAIITAKQDSLSAPPIDGTITSLRLIPDFGFGVESKSLVLLDQNLSVHQNEIRIPQKFDPKHLTIQQASLHASEVKIHDDTLRFNLLSASVGFPGVFVDTIRGTVDLNDRQLDVTGLQVGLANSSLAGDLQTRLENGGYTKPNLDVQAGGLLRMEDIVYFLPDTLESWLAYEQNLKFDINIVPQGSNKESVDIRFDTDHSSLAMNGDIAGIPKVDDISWKDLSIHATIGKDMQNLISSLSNRLKFPPGGMDMSFRSSGDQHSVALEGIVNSSLGSLKFSGSLSPGQSGLGMDMLVSGSNLSLGDYLDIEWLGPAAFSLMARGTLSDQPDLMLKGNVSNIEIADQTIRDLELESVLIRDSIRGNLIIHDTSFQSRVAVRGGLIDPMQFNTAFQLERFNIGRLMKGDSTLNVSGNFKGDLSIRQSGLALNFSAKDYLLENIAFAYRMDSLVGTMSITPDSSFIEYEDDDSYVNLSANFDLRRVNEALKILSRQLVEGRMPAPAESRSRAMTIQASLADPGLLVMAGIDIDTFSLVVLSGSWEEDTQSMRIHANTGKMTAFGLSCDTIDITLDAKGTHMTSGIFSDNLHFENVDLGDLQFAMHTEQDTSRSNLSLTSDSLKILDLDTRLIVQEDDIALFMDKFIFYDEEYQVSTDGPLLLSSENVVIKDLRMAHNQFEIALDGDMWEYDLELRNLLLKKLDPVLFPDSAVINDGVLNAKLTYIVDEKLNLDARIENLVLLESTPFAMTLQSASAGNEMPFDFLLTNAGSSIQTTGVYDVSEKDLSADLSLDVENPEAFKFFYQNYLEEVKGEIRGAAKVSGHLKKPDFDGKLKLENFRFSTRNPKLTFRVREDSVRFNQKGLILDDFMIFDDLNQVLLVSGNIQNDNYTSLSYDLDIKTDQYALINRPINAPELLKGTLILGTDINLRGNQKDTYVKADIHVRDETDLVLTLPERENQLLKTEGIIEFVKPSALLDTTLQVAQITAYDSIIAHLPDFTLSSNVIVEENAGLTILIDPQSGDYFKVSGKAELFLEYDRTGNPILNGVFEAVDGVYSLSFYDLVKKDFTLVKGSSISWAGAPDDGVLDIHAVYNIQSNSIGLVGHEVGENEKSVYKKTLEYKVSINILGTIHKPEITFSLDLPEEDKITYPALANKLSRLTQPEYQSELNKQVFGLLVLGSFIPEASGYSGGQTDMATTALYNSVNGLLSSQLNKFANQYIKGVNIDVGIQSYSDYATNGGKTQTSMDFHVSKSMLNDRLVFEVGGDFDIGSDQSGANTGSGYRGDMAIIYDLTGNGDKKLKFFNNESYDIIYQEIRNTGIALIFIREFDKGEIKNNKRK